MSIRTVLLCSALMAGAAVAPGVSQARVIVDVDVAPPAARVEVVPAPRHGYVWAPGYWSWSGHRHEWTAGHWVRERRGFHWVPEQWVQRGPHWHFEPGHWDRD